MILITSLMLVVLSCSAALLLTPLVRAFALYAGAVDYPEARKLHSTPMPRLGGLSVILAGYIAVMMTLGAGELINGGTVIQLDAWRPLFPGMVIVLMIGIWDDIQPRPVWIKFLFQAAAACVTIGLGIRVEHISLLGGTGTDLGILAFPLTFVWIVGITNAFNLIDGLDGLAAGLAMIAAGALAIFFFLTGEIQNTLIGLVLFGSLLGFLRYNFNPARIFLGDSGSLVLGYTLSIMAIRGSQKSVTTLAVIIPLLVFGIPIVDTLLSMTRRFIVSAQMFGVSKGAPKERLLCTRAMFEADKRHIHHRLLALGLSHRSAVLLLYSVALGLSVLALLSALSKYRNAGIILIGTGIATYMGICKLGYNEIAFPVAGTILRWWKKAEVNRRLLLGCADAGLISLAYWGAFILKYDTAWTTELLTWYMQVFPIKLGIQLSVFVVLGLYQNVWHAAGLPDFCRAVLVVITALATSYTIIVLSSPPPGALSFFGIDGLISLISVIGLRSLYYVLDSMHQNSNSNGKIALIYGAEQEGQLVLCALRQDPDYALCPIGFLDGNPMLHGRFVHHIPVIGSVDSLKMIIEQRPVSNVIISSSNVDPYHLHQVIRVCQEQGIEVTRYRLQFEALNEDSICDTRLG
jgi:UDP-GlcNAc:undecaprenyl-phosphate GlcNAc-1-phosphate transferase